MYVLNMSSKTARLFTVGIKIPWGNISNSFLQNKIHATKYFDRTLINLHLNSVTLTLTFPSSHKYKIIDNIIKITPANNELDDHDDVVAMLNGDYNLKLEREYEHEHEHEHEQEKTKKINGIPISVPMDFRLY